MVAIAAIRASNQGIKGLPPHQVAIFIGATSGIGEQALIQFTQNTIEPTVYIVGRSQKAAAPLLADLKQRNPKAILEFIEKDASLIRDIDSASAIIKGKQQKVDFLFLSAGFISFSGRQGMSSGLSTITTGQMC
jgi:short-subunit dehydrogenase